MASEPQVRTETGLGVGLPGIGKSACVVILIAACLLVYAQTIRMDFVYDDIAQLKEPSIIWSEHIFRDAFGVAANQFGGGTPYYRPLHILSLALDHNLWRTNPAGFHAANVLLHCCAVLLVFQLVLGFVKNNAAALAAALLFALHPVQAEPVTWICARGDILCAIFMAGSFLGYLKFADCRNYLFLALSAFLMLCALLSKEVAMALPVLIVFHAAFVSGRRRLVPLVSYVVPVAMYIMLRVMVMQAQSWEYVPLTWRVYTGLGLVTRYVVNTLFPVNLRIFYDIPVQKELFAPAVLIPTACVAAIVAGFVLLWRTQRSLTFCGVWFFLAIFPVSGFITFLRPALIADRYLYVPLIGVAIGIGILFDRVQRKWGTRAFWAWGFVLAILATQAFCRTLPWKDQKTFSTQIVADAPESFFGYFFKALILGNEGRYDESIAAFTKVLEMGKDLSETHFGRGTMFFEKGLYAQAREDFLANIRLDPRSWKGYSNLGVTYVKLGQLEEASAAFRQSLLLNPGNYTARNYLMQIQKQRGVAAGTSGR